MFKTYRAAVLGAWTQLDAAFSGFLRTWAESPQGTGLNGPHLSLDRDAVPDRHAALECASGTWHVPGHCSRKAFTHYLRISCEANGLELGKDVILADADDA